MKFGTQRDQVRTVVRDAQGDFITDDDIDVWLNEAQRDIANRVKGLQKLATATVAAGSVIPLPADLVKVHSLRLTGQTWPAQFTDDATWASWSDTGGNPNVTLYRIFGDSIYLFPDATGSTYTLEYSYEPADLVDTDDESLLPKNLHSKMVNYARAQALLKAGDTSLADRYLVMFEEGLPAVTIGRERRVPGPLSMSFARGPFDTTDARHW